MFYHLELVMILFAITAYILIKLFNPAGAGGWEENAPSSKMSNKNLSPLDPSSFARPEFAIITDVHLNLTVNFTEKTLKGNVDLTVEKKDPNVQELILDVKDLNISKIVDENGTKLPYNITDTVDEIGSKLTVQVPPSTNNKYKISIFYSTNPEASGLQWLSPLQTAGKKHPYLFSQFQPIHARSVLPCQDTPAVKFKYTATIIADAEYTVLMSAKRNGTESTAAGKVSKFVQDVPVPSYLLAIAAGVLESRKLGPRTHVWAEKEIIEASAYEFANTEHQLKTAEDLCGPYVWGIYDLLVLPPSFPFGGMENPCLTFVTPTLLAGDRSLANVVAHEIAHSWTGNLITNRNFEHFWLNEGFTVFIERKIKGRLETPQDQDFDAYMAVSELQEAVQQLGEKSEFTKLVINLSGVHPDDAFSRVPYEKGQTFLRYLESIVGGPEQFEPFLKKYFETFKYKSIDTGDFKKFFETQFANKSEIKTVDWDKWLYTPGMPPIIPDYDKSLAKNVDQLKIQFLQTDNSHEYLSKVAAQNKLTPDQMIYFLHSIFQAPKQSISKLQTLEKLYKLDSIKNSEIRFLWFRICLKGQWEDKLQDVLNWVNEVGRMKFVRPLYRDLYAWESARPKAIENFQANRKYMMHVLEYGLVKDLHLQK